MSELHVEPVLTGPEVAGRAIRSSVTLAVRGLGLRALGFAGSLVLARLLAPDDFGVLALGVTVLQFAILFADGGVGAGLIRQVEPVEREVLAAVQAFQLLVSSAAAALALLAVPFTGEPGLVVALALVAMPVATLQSAGAITLQRQLRFGPLVVVELVGSAAYFAWGVGAVLLGFGVVGLATGFAAQAVVSALLMSRLSPVGLVRPSWSWPRVRGLLGFGARYQAVPFLGLVRDQGLNLAVAAIAGLTTLGWWNLAYRVLQVPFLLFESLWQVSFPAMSRFLAAGDDPKPAIEQALRLGGAGSAVLLAMIGGASPTLMEGLFGDRWGPAGDVLPYALLALLVSGPLSVAVVGYLYASGDTTVVLRATALHVLLWFAVALPLLPSRGIVALGYGWLAASLLDAVILGRAVRSRLGVRPLRCLAPAGAACLAAAGAGAAVASRIDRPLVATVAGTAVATVDVLLLLLVLAPGSVRTALRLVSGLRGA